MSQFVVSARKYRPVRFESVVGQQHVWQTLKNAIRQQHLAHAFLFCGPRGVGKTTCARILAKVLNCERPTQDIEPCGECDSCKAFQNNSSLNVYELDAASNNSVENIRTLIEQVRFPPQKGQYKIYIIDEVHMLSSAAFNAFLKTLEEPPSYAIFILATTEKHKILPTILSRCQVFEFHRITIADMVSHLATIAEREGVEAEEDALNLVAQKADGGLRDALSMFDRLVSYGNNRLSYVDALAHLNVLDHSFYFSTLDSVMAEDFGRLLLLFHEVLAKGFEPDLFVAGLAEHLRNLLVCQDARTADLLEVGGSVAKRYGEQAEIAPMPLLLTCLNLCNECDLYYKTARNKRLHVEIYLMKMAYALRVLQAEPLRGSEAEKKKPEVLSLENQDLPKTEVLVAPTKEVPMQQEAQAEKQQKLQALKQLQQMQVGGLQQVVLAQQQKAQVQKQTPEVQASLAYRAEDLAAWWAKYIEGKGDAAARALYAGVVFELHATQLLLRCPSEAIEKQLSKQDRTWPDALRQVLGPEYQKLDLRVVLDLSLGQNVEIEAPKSVVQPQNLPDREKYRLMLLKNPNLKALQSLLQLYPKDK